MTLPAFAAERCAPTASAATSTAQTWNWVIGSPGQWVIWVIFHVQVTGSPGRHFDPVRPEFFGFRKNAKNAKRTFEMLK